MMGGFMRSPQSRARERERSGIFPSTVGVPTPPSETDVVRVAGCFSCWVTGALPLGTSGASVGRRRVNGNQRCSPPPDAEESSCEATSERRASEKPREPPGEGSA